MTPRLYLPRAVMRPQKARLLPALRRFGMPGQVSSGPGFVFSITFFKATATAKETD